MVLVKKTGICIFEEGYGKALRNLFGQINTKNCGRCSFARIVMTTQILCKTAMLKRRARDRHPRLKAMNSRIYAKRYQEMTSNLPE